jgi:hypothetical protein
MLALELVRRANLRDALTDHGDGNAAPHLRIAHLGAAASASRAGAGDDL